MAFPGRGQRLFQRLHGHFSLIRSSTAVPRALAWPTTRANDPLALRMVPSLLRTAMPIGRIVEEPRKPHFAARKFSAASDPGERFSTRERDAPGCPGRRTTPGAARAPAPPCLRRKRNRCRMSPPGRRRDRRQRTHHPGAVLAHNVGQFQSTVGGLGQIEPQPVGQRGVDVLNVARRRRQRRNPAGE